MVSSSFSSSSKRARALSGGGPIASCLVDGCVSDLSKCREYHRRHKVCEVHAKTATVMVGGREQRFCQQCSRFHLLVEFDEVKRSCRKRLEGHNRRRRKPQLRSLNSGAFMTNHQAPCLLTGTRFTSYPQVFSVTAAKSNRAPVVKAEEVPFYPHHSPQHLISGHHDYEHFPISSHGIYKDGKRFPFLQENVQAAPAPACQPLIKNFSAIGSQNSRSKLCNSACALSLLSSPEACSSRVNLCQAAATGDRIPIGQPVIPSMQCDGLGRFYGSQAFNSVSATGFLCSGIEHEHDGTVLISDSNDEFQSHGSFHVGGEGSSDGIPQTLSFSWQ